MGSWWRRFGGWVLFAGATVVGAAVTFVFAGQTAGVIVAVVGAATGFVAARGRNMLDNRAARRAALPGAVVGGRLRRVRDSTDPIALGVHPAAADTTGNVPPYVRRDFQQTLDTALSESRFVLLSGESTAGKSRAAYEAMHRLLPDHLLVAPAGRESIRTIVDVVLEHRRCVVWLDDIERFIGNPGLTAADVTRMTESGALLLGTIRIAEQERFGARHEAELGAAQRDSWRTAREVLRLATEIPVSRHWTDSELDNARRATDDRRIRSALTMTDRFGLAELLADGPELANDWHAAWRPGGHPRGAALVAAAVACRMATIYEPVPIDLLGRLAEHYLTARGGPALRPEPLADALAWATKPARAASSLLLPAAEPDHYLAFDYLIDLPGDPVPVPVWLDVIEWCTAEQALSVGLTARVLERFDAAETAFRKAYDADVPGALVELTLEIATGGKPLEAMELLQAAVAAHPDRSNEENARLLATMGRIAQQAGDTEMAAATFAWALELASDVYGPDHPETLAIRRQAAIRGASDGEAERAVRLLGELIPDHVRVQGPDHLETLRTRHLHAIWTGRGGDPATALTLFIGLLADRTRIQGADHPNVLSTRFEIAVWTSNGGDPDAAIPLFEDLLRDSTRILGADHPHTVSAHYRLGLAARKAGWLGLAREHLTIVLAEWTRRFGPEHDGVRRVRRLLDELDCPTR